MEKQFSQSKSKFKYGKQFSCLWWHQWLFYHLEALLILLFKVVPVSFFSSHVLHLCNRLFAFIPGWNTMLYAIEKRLIHNILLLAGLCYHDPNNFLRLDIFTKIRCVPIEAFRCTCTTRECAHKIYYVLTSVFLCVHHYKLHFQSENLFFFSFTIPVVAALHFSLTVRMWIKNSTKPTTKYVVHCSEIHEIGKFVCRYKITRTRSKFHPIVLIRE